MHILPNISRSTGNQAMKFGQLLEYSKKKFFFKNHAENDPGKLLSELIFLFKNIMVFFFRVMTA